MDANMVLDIREKLANFETMSWAEILVDAKKYNHQISVDQICQAATERLRELKLDDVDQLLSLRLQATQRVWGLLERGVVTLLWWDPNHEICPSVKKHT